MYLHFRALLATLVMLVAACGGARVAPPLLGPTMGTQYSVQFGQDVPRAQRQALAEAIEADLAEIDLQMSTWRDDSEISRFNAQRSTDWFEVSAATVEVVSRALAVSQLSNGAFDVTAGPLIDLWGFGASLPARAMPGEDDIAAVRPQVGWHLVATREAPPALRKLHRDVAIDLSAIAKGYGVDRLAARISAAGVRDFLVEIGGELCARGVNRHGEPWVIAVESPRPDQPPQALLRPGYRCIATSGDYRNYFEIDGQRYAHAIDPRSGRPITHRLASVTVVATDAMTADAWATALLVLGEDRGYALARRYDAAALFISRDGEAFRTERTTAFAGLEAP